MALDCDLFSNRSLPLWASIAQDFGLLSVRRGYRILAARHYPEGGIMKEKIQNWLHDLGVALGLIEPPLQPVPIRTDDEQRRRQQRRR
jgi:hypothetical protein